MAIEMNLRGTSLDTFRIGRDKLVFDASGLTALRTLTLPDADGTLGLSGSQDWGAVTDPPDDAIANVDVGAVVDIDGGSIDGTTIGANTAAPATITALTVTDSAALPAGATVGGTAVSLDGHGHATADIAEFPVAGWASPSGSGYIKGGFNADDETSITDPPTGTQVLDMQNRLKDTRAVLRALILDLKLYGVLGS